MNLADSFISELKSLMAHSRNDGMTATHASRAQTFGWSENDMADILSEIEKNSDV